MTDDDEALTADEPVGRLAHDPPGAPSQRSKEADWVLGLESTQIARTKELVAKFGPMQEGQSFQVWTCSSFARSGSFNRPGKAVHVVRSQDDRNRELPEHVEKINVDTHSGAVIV